MISESAVFLCRRRPPCLTPHFPKSSWPETFALAQDKCELVHTYKPFLIANYESYTYFFKFPRKCLSSKMSVFFVKKIFAKPKHDLMMPNQKKTSPLPRGPRNFPQSDFPPPNNDTRGRIDRTLDVGRDGHMFWFLGGGNLWVVLLHACKCWENVELFRGN